MSPQVIGKMEVEEVRSDPRVRSFELLVNVPFQVAGPPGFKLVYSFRAVNGPRLKRVHCGVLVRDWVYRIQYQGPARYDFGKDRATLEGVRESFRLL